MPASGRFLLDTNIVIALLQGDETVLSNLDQALASFRYRRFIAVIGHRAGHFGST
jgi:predicted nucleic acid-binding protein